jgi:hypothetical protein
LTTFEETTLVRLRRYRAEAGETVRFAEETEQATRRFADRLFGGLEYVAELARRSGFEGLAAERTGGSVRLEVALRPGMETSATFGVLRGTAAENEEALMHEGLSRWGGEPSGYSGRVLGWSSAAGEEACQVFAVYRDGVWKTDGRFVARSRGRLTDPDEVMNGFCLRILGRVIDLAASTQGASRSWAEGAYPLSAYLEGQEFPVEIRWPR